MINKEERLIANQGILKALYKLINELTAIEFRHATKVHKLAHEIKIEIDNYQSPQVGNYNIKSND